ncbi:hypothetical protein KEM48_014614, partial [Puccinia striiformis f. sp. tritici PST-130]
PRLALDQGPPVEVLDIQLLMSTSDVLPVHVYIIPAPSRINALLQAPSIKYFSDACTDLMFEHSGIAILNVTTPSSSIKLTNPYHPFYPTPPSYSTLFLPRTAGYISHNIAYLVKGLK